MRPISSGDKPGVVWHDNCGVMVVMMMKVATVMVVVVSRFRVGRARHLTSSRNACGHDGHACYKMGVEKPQWNGCR